MRTVRGRFWSLLAVGLAVCAVLGFHPAAARADDAGAQGGAAAGKGAVSPEKKDAGAQTQAAANPRVRMKTSEGVIVLELDAKSAPVSVANFLEYVKTGGYNGTIFHRVIKDFMIQGGGFEPGMKKKPTRPPIINEAKNGLKNEKGTVAMARTMEVNSATNQFFINTKHNTSLDHRGDSPRTYGYAVFGKVVDGMDVVEKIEKVPTGTNGSYQDVPVKDVVIESVTLEKP